MEEETKTITLKKINDQKVEPIEIKRDKRKVKGEDLCKECYCNIACIAPTNSGKTTALFKMLKDFAGPNTTIIAFVSTIYNDANWIEIRKYFDEKKINFITHMSTKEDGIDHLKEIVDHMSAEAKKEEEAKQAEEEPLDILKMLAKADGFVKFMNEEDKEEPKNKPKFQAPDFIFIFDDVGDELKFESYQILLKKSRHYKIKTITSTQYLKDIKPGSRTQMRIWLLFSGIPEGNLEVIHEAMNMRLELPLFEQLYKKATEKTDNCPKPFFYVNNRDDDYRRNFNQKFNIPSKYL